MLVQKNFIPSCEKLGNKNLVQQKQSMLLSGTPLFRNTPPTLVRCQEEIFHQEGGEALKRVAQRSGECPILGDIQGHAEGALSTLISCRHHCSLQGSWTRWSLKALSNSWFYDSMTWKLSVSPCCHETSLAFLRLLSLKTVGWDKGHAWENGLIS